MEAQLSQLNELYIMMQRMEAKLDALAPTDDRWVPLMDAWSDLGHSSHWQCRRLIESGFYRIGIEVRDMRSPNSSRPKYQMNIGKCLERAREKPEFRN